MPQLVRMLSSGWWKSIFTSIHHHSSSNYNSPHERVVIFVVQKCVALNLFLFLGKTPSTLNDFFFKHSSLCFFNRLKLSQIEKSFYKSFTDFFTPSTCCLWCAVSPIDHYLKCYVSKIRKNPCCFQFS